MTGAVLAQVPTSPPEVDRQTIQDWLDQGGQTLQQLPELIGDIDVVMAALLLVVGVVSLLYGFRIVKGVVVVYCAVGGAAGGWWLVSEPMARPDLWWVGLLAGGAVMALLAWPLVNFFIRFYGFVAGGLAGVAVTYAMADQRAMLIGAAIGAILGGILAAVVFRFMVIMMTSILGSYMAVIGILALLYRVDKVAEPLRRSLTEQHFILPLVMAVPAAVGIAYQLYRTERRETREDNQADAKGD
jgi:uncharacterized protein DUF4203